ncbi:MAG: phytanoyl-CoA dioxygenase family protein [Vicinamibacterales bacterium]
MTPTDGRIDDAGFHEAVDAMHRLGFVAMQNVLPLDLVKGLAHAWDERYQSIPAERAALEVGNRRNMVTLEMSRPFNDPSLYANPYVLPVVNGLLGGEAVLMSFTCVCALPGAAAQHVHRDHPALFPETHLSGLLPCSAVTVMVPLVNLDDRTGTTAVWLGSHRGTHDEKPDWSNVGDAVLPKVNAGSVYLMDYRLTHGGTANMSDRPRPVLSLVYARRWFIDAVNFRHQPMLDISAADLASIPDEFAFLFSRAASPQSGPAARARI